MVTPLWDNRERKVQSACPETLINVLMAGG
jgi:hypothetical protein